MERHGTKNGINYAIQESYVPPGRLKEIRCWHQYGIQKELSMPLCNFRFPICSRKKEDKLIDLLTKLIANTWDINPQKQS